MQAYSARPVIPSHGHAASSQLWRKRPAGLSFGHIVYTRDNGSQEEIPPGGNSGQCKPACGLYGSLGVAAAAALMAVAWAFTPSDGAKNPDNPAPWNISKLLPAVEEDQFQ